MPLQTLDLGPTLETALASGHPWVYRRHLPAHRLRTGDWVRVQAGRASACGLYDDDGPIAVRLFARAGVPDRAWFEARVREALALRAPLEASGTDAYRLLFGEGDGLPGITVDRYGRYAVLLRYSDGVRTAVPEVVRALSRALPLRGIAERLEGGLEPLWGELPPPELTIRENGLRFLANPFAGQKSGLYLDQRDNRALVRTIAAGREVLNLFSYSGGFSVYALAGGARRVVSVDRARAALEDAVRNVAANGLEAARHQVVAADVAEDLQGRLAAGEAFDLIVLDPPSLARRKGQRHAAARAYRRLNALALRCLRPGGLLATASCTAQVSPEMFREALGEAAAEAGVRAQVIHEAGQPQDHPVPLHFPEGRYLKFLLLRVLPGQLA